MSLYGICPHLHYFYPFCQIALQLCLLLVIMLIVIYMRFPCVLTFKWKFMFYALYTLLPTYVMLLRLNEVYCVNTEKSLDWYTFIVVVVQACMYCLILTPVTCRKAWCMVWRWAGSLAGTKIVSMQLQCLLIYTYMITLEDYLTDSVTV